MAATRLDVVPLEAGLRGTGDDESLAYIVAQRRMTFTEDDDFLRIHAAGTPHPASPPTSSKRGASASELICGLLHVRDIHEPGEVANRIEYR